MGMFHRRGEREFTVFGLFYFVPSFVRLCELRSHVFDLLPIFHSPL